MTILNDREITKLATEHGMITPFNPDLVTSGKISHGISSFGYDAILSTEFKKFKSVKENGEWVVVDPKKGFTSDEYETVINEGSFILPPRSFILGRTVERFKIPDNVLVICMGKSTYARCGIHVIVTPLEPGWEGTVTLEIFNSLDQPVRIYPNEGICQFLFIEGNSRPNTTYADRKGKYQGQTDVTLPKVLSGKEDVGVQHISV
jgi:dCTP deaminase